MSTGQAKESFDVVVSIAWQAGSPDGPFDVLAKPLLAENGVADQVVQATAGRLRLSKGAWSISVQRTGFWAPAEVVVVDRAGQSVRLSAWPSGTVHGRFAGVAADVAQAATQLSLGFASAPSEKTGPPSGVVPCALDGMQWTCEVPAATLDLQLSLPGFATTYEWDRDVRAGAVTELGSLELHRGGSVIGWIEDSRGAAPGPDATVSLGASDSAAEVRAGMVVKSNRRGFFQMVGVASGSYLLRARKAGAATTTARVRVAAGTETRLVQPIVLAPPATLAVSVDPPLGPDGKEWTIEVLAIREGEPDTVAMEALPRKGTWRRMDLAGGRYHVAVSSGKDEQWWGEEVELEPGRLGEVVAHLPILVVGGSVLLGDRPLPNASLSFGGPLSQVRLTTRADSAGVFSIRLPRPGKWTVDVEADKPRIHRSLRSVEVEATGPGEGRAAVILTDAVVNGHVRDEAGLALVAHVRAVLEGGGDSLVGVESGPDGAFEVRGLPAGPVTLVANARGGLLSDPVSVRAGEHESERTPVELIVRRPQVVQGVVFSADGEVPRARVAAFPLPLGSPIMPVSTDEAGRFEVRVPTGTSELAIAVSALGYGYKIVRHPLVSDESILILLEAGEGTLRIVLPDQPDAALDAFVLHDGGFSGLMALRRWAVQNGAGAQIGRQVSVPMMPPGVYVACVGGRARLQAALNATTPPDRCVSGTLPDGGELELRLAP